MNRRDSVRLHNTAIGWIAACGIIVLVGASVAIPTCALHSRYLQQPNSSPEGDRYREPTGPPLPGEEFMRMPN